MSTHRPGWPHLALGLLLGLAACDGARHDGARDAAEDTRSPDDTTNDARDEAAAVGDTDRDAEVQAGEVACGHGGLTCGPDEACVGTGQGACGGPEPGPDGCGPDCEAFACDGAMHCLCSGFECQALDACRTCACLLARPGNASCLCEEEAGRFTLGCPGA